MRTIAKRLIGVGRKRCRYKVKSMGVALALKLVFGVTALANRWMFSLGNLLVPKSIIPSMVLPSRLQPKVPSQTCLLSDSGNPVDANRRIPITRPIFDNFDSAGQIHNRRGGTALIDNAQKYD